MVGAVRREREGDKAGEATKEWVGKIGLMGFLLSSQKRKREK